MLAAWEDIEADRQLLRGSLHGVACMEMERGFGRSPYLVGLYGCVMLRRYYTVNRPVINLGTVNGIKNQERWLQMTRTGNNESR